MQNETNGKVTDVPTATKRSVSGTFERRKGCNTNDVGLRVNTLNLEIFPSPVQLTALPPLTN